MDLKVASDRLEHYNVRFGSSPMFLLSHRTPDVILLRSEIEL